MNQFKKIKIGLLVCAALGCGALQAATQIAGDDATPPGNFTQNITAKAFDRETGKFYVATVAAITTGGKEALTMAKAGPTDTEFTGLATAATAENQPANVIIAANAGATNLQLPSPLMSLIKGTADKFLVAITGGTGTNNTVGTFNADTGAFVGRTAALTLAGGGAIVVAGATTNVKLATGTAILTAGATGKAFVYVHPAAPGGANSGVCSANIALADGTVVAGAAAGLGQAQPLNAVDGILATHFDAAGILGRDNSNDATAGNNGEVGTAADNGCWVNDLYWDEELKVLYAGLSVRARQGANAVNFSYALVKATLSGAGAVEAFARAGGLVNDHGLPAAVAAGADPDTVFAVQGNTNAFAAAAVVRKIRGMKTSTNKKYLIVNAQADHDTHANLDFAVPTVYALRLNDVPGNANIGNVVRNTAAGTDALPDNWHNDPAGLANTYLGATQVGAGPLPFDAAQFVTDMEVIGDAVYASVGIRAGAPGVRDADNDTGVFVSRALFNNNGVIIGWTPWEHVVTSEESDGTGLDAIHFFAVDANRGNVWKVCKASGGDAPVVVKRTGLRATDFTANSLPERLNTDLAGSGCTAVLDLPTGTPGIAGAGNTHNSFALFGGDGKVVFAQTKSDDANVVTTDFTNFYVSTDLPAGAGYVRALGASRNVEDATRGYFFAGTDNGLYVWADPAAGSIGFNGEPNNAAGLTTIGAAGENTPFGDNGGNKFDWARMADTGDNAITGAVTAIEANGSHVFVVEQDVTRKGSIVSKLHRFEIADNVATMIGTNHAIIAQSGAGGIDADAIFTGFAIVSNTGVRATETFGLLATNNGLFKSAVHLVSPVTPPATLAWTAIDAAKACIFLQGVKRVPGTVAPNTQDGYALGASTVVLDDAGDGKNYYQNSKLFNSGLDFATAGSMLRDYTNSEGAIDRFDRSLSFWTDGGRRFFTRFAASEPEALTLVSHPFATTEWGMVDGAPHPFSTAPRVHFIENISGLGIVVMGTDTGVITIE